MLRIASDNGLSTRHDAIIEFLELNGFTSVQDLSERFGVSAATIRRDLAELESADLIQRTHGGALAQMQIGSDRSNADRETLNLDEKAAIGAAAAAMIEDGDAVFLDAGTTTLQIARHLVQRSGLTIVTNGIEILHELTRSSGNVIYSLEGEFNALNLSVTGPLAVASIKRFSVDKAILSASAIDVERGLLSMSIPDFACVQQAVLDIASDVFVVADHSKFARRALATTCRLDELDQIITDDGLDEGLRARIRAYSPKLTCVPVGQSAGKTR